MIYFPIQILKQTVIFLAPYYDYLQPTAEWIMSSIFVQYLVIKSIFSLTVCRIYNLYGKLVTLFIHIADLQTKAHKP